MDFELNEEQRLLKDSVERLLADHYEFEARKTYMEAPEGFGRKLWAKYAELGLLGLPFEERFGGFGGGPVETMIVAATRRASACVWSTPRRRACRGAGTRRSTAGARRS